MKRDMAAFAPSLRIELARESAQRGIGMRSLELADRDRGATARHDDDATPPFGGPCEVAEHEVERYADGEEERADADHFGRSGAGAFGEDGHAEVATEREGEQAHV